MTTDTTTGHRPENLVLGAALTTAAFFCIALVGALAKVSDQYTSTGVILLSQNFVGMLLVVPLAVRGGWAFVRTERFGLHVLRSAAGTACWYGLFFAIAHIPLANATLITYSAPLWMPLIAWAVSRQRVSALTWAGAGLGFIGVMLVLQPQSASFGLGELSALIGAVSLAIAMMTVRWLGATEPMARVLFYYFVLSTVMAVPFAVADWRPLPAGAWMWLAALGIAQVSSQALIVLGYRYAPAEKVGPCIYSVIVFSALIDWLVWHHPPTLLMYAGTALVIGGGLVAVRAKAGAPQPAAEAADDGDDMVMATPEGDGPPGT